MRFFLALLSIGLILVTGVDAGKIQPVTMYDSIDGHGTAQLTPKGGRYEPTQIDTAINGIRYIYGNNLGWVDQDQDGAWWYLFAHNDTYIRVNTIMFTEEQMTDPGSWVQQYVYEGDETIDLRYTSCQAVMADGFLYPQVFLQYDSNNAVCEYTYDEFGMAGGGWTTSVPLNDPPTYPDDHACYLPLTGAVDGTGDNYLDGQDRGYSSDSHWLWKQDFLGERIGGPYSVFPSPDWEDLPAGTETVYGLGYERSNLVTCPMGQIVMVQVPGYRVGEAADSMWLNDPTNPLIPALRISQDYGETWGDIVWVDNAACPDLPGTNTGCDNASSGWGYGWQKQVATLIGADGVIHLAATLMDPAHNTAPDNFDSIGATDYGLWHIWGVPNEGDYEWNAVPITIGTGNVPPFPEGSFLGGTSAITSPSLAVTPDGNIVCGFTDVSEVLPDSNWFMDYYVIGSGDNGVTWGDEPINVTDNPGTDMVYFRLMPQTTTDYACVYGIPDQYSNQGPYWAYFVPLEDIDFPTSGSADLAEKAVSLTLGDVYPNPTAGMTELQFSLSDRAKVQVVVHDVAGHQVANIADGYMGAGSHTVSWNASDAASGVYFFQVTAGDKTASKPVTLVR